MTSLMCAEVAKARGQVRTATRWLRQGIAGLRSADPGGWSFVALVALTGALGMTGDATSARQALMEMTAARHPTFAFVEPTRYSPGLGLLPRREVSARPSR